MFEQNDFYGMEEEGAIFLTTTASAEDWQYVTAVDAEELAALAY